MFFFFLFQDVIQKDLQDFYAAVRLTFILGM